MNEIMSTCNEVLYREGDQLRRLKGRIEQFEQLDALGFVQVRGLNRTIYLNPALIERVEVRDQEEQCP